MDRPLAVSPTDRYSNLLAPGQDLSGFTVISAERLEEIGGWAYVLRHRATGASLLWLANGDENRAFAITFKTPPTNDTGVFHILEHSVLDGSEKYPVKEPFVELLKTSMQTFLNAMTFPDKTMYPVASTNVDDLENLMDVYLDAVLHPRIYDRPRIFEQEGWHYELSEPDGQLQMNGVVFNEMKGALSDPDEILLMGVKAALFPDTCYRWESGGDPASIPELNYEEFIDTHARHYRMDNSHTVLYGDLDIARELAFLDERFLAAPAPGEFGPNELAIQEPVSPEPVVVPMATSPDNGTVGLAYVLGAKPDRTTLLATDVLLDVLLGSNEAPLKRAVLDAGLGDDLVGYLFDGIAQPFVLFQLKGAKPGVAGEFRTLVETTCARLACEGLDPDRVEAALAQAEFNLRENLGGYPDGVSYAIGAMASWLYDEDDPISYLRYEDACAELRRSMGLGTFEDLLRSLVVDSAHSALVTVEPRTGTATAAEADKLAAVKEAMDDSWLQAVAAEAEALTAEQEAPDDPAEIEKLPRLTSEQIGEAVPEPAPETVEAPYPCTTYAIDTHRIDYLYYYFDLAHVGWRELPYVAVMAELLGKLDTKRHTAAELDTLVEGALGNLTFHLASFGDGEDPAKVSVKLVVSAAALREKLSGLATLPEEVWSETLFEDTDRMRAILTQRRISMEQYFTGAGHGVALNRVNSHLNASAAVSEQTSGIDFYRFLVDLLDGWERKSTTLCELLRNLQGRIFKGEVLETCFCGEPGDVEAFWAEAGDLGLSHGGLLPKPLLEVVLDGPAREGFTIPANVCFVAEGAAGAALPHSTSYNGHWVVAARALSYGYLWNEVRVKGGAYGSGFRTGRLGLLDYYSYRDPAVDPTLRRYDGAAAWLEGWAATPEELDGYIVSSVAAMDAPMKPRAQISTLESLRLSGVAPGFRQEIRQQVLDTTLMDVHILGLPLGEVSQEGGVCVVGGPDILKASHGDLTITELVANPDQE